MRLKTITPSQRKGRNRMRPVLFAFLPPLFLAGLFAASTVHASFGITPPYVRNEGLTRNSTYTQEILVVRGNPSEDLEASISIDVPGADGWITVDQGNKFILPKDAKTVPMRVQVTVPKDAEFRRYKGNMRIRVSSFAAPVAGAVNISLGAQIDVDLNVVDKKIFDFKVLRVEVGDLEEGRYFWWLYFPGKIRFTMQLENTGNVPAAPKKVTMKITNHKNEVVEEIENTNRIKKIESFEIGDAMAELPTRLKPGSYTAEYRIYKTDDEVAQQGEVHLSVLPFGTLPGYTGYGFIGLTLTEKSQVIGIILAILGILSYIGMMVYRLIQKRRQQP